MSWVSCAMEIVCWMLIGVFATAGGVAIARLRVKSGQPSIDRHQVANDLAGIQGYAELIRSRLPAADTVSQSYLDDLALLVSRIDAQLFPAQAASQGASSVAAQVTGIEATLAERCDTEIDEGVAERQVTGSLAQMLELLIVNAADACPDRQVRVTARASERAEHRRCVTCNDLIPAGGVDVSVKDRGAGIPSSVLPFIFRPGFSTHNNDGSRGYGLPALSNLIHQAGGHVQLVTDHRGTEVCLALAPEMRASYESEQRPESAPSKTSRIMIVDDQASAAGFLREVLMRAGHEVDVYVDPLTAWTTFEAGTGHYDLVITDQTMSPLPGDELMSKMHGLRPDLPVIICSGYSERIHEHQALRLGARGFLKKPIDQAALFAVVNESLAGS